MRGTSDTQIRAAAIFVADPAAMSASRSPERGGVALAINALRSHKTQVVLDTIVLSVKIAHLPVGYAARKALTMRAVRGASVNPICP